MSKTELLLTAHTPISHGDKTLGTITYLRRERYMSASGEVIDIPTISGNAFRGALRDAAAQKFCDFLDLDLTLPISHALWSGGKISKATTIPLSGEKLRRVREVAPPLSLLGWASAGRIISGSLSVGNILPLCEELKHLLPEEYRDSTLPSYWDVTQLDEFSHFPDEEEEETSLMRYGYESFIPGTRFYSWLSCHARNSNEEGFLAEIVQDFMEGATQLGGNKNRGNGLFNGEYRKNPRTDEDWRTNLLSVYTPEEIVQTLKDHIK